MNNKYLVIDQDGNEHDPKVYVADVSVDPEFRLLIQREALGVGAGGSVAGVKFHEYARKLGFCWEENAPIGFLQYNYKANLIMELVKLYARQLVVDIGFPIYEVRGSNFFDLKHPVVEAYADLFGERLLRSKNRGDNLVMSYDASYPQFNLASKMQLKAKDLPFAHFSISDCYRYEQSGECMLMFRGRRFFMPDLHPYLKSVDEAFEWYPKIDKVIRSAMEPFGKQYWNLVKVSSENNWEKYREQIVSAVGRAGKPFLVDIRQNKEEKYWVIDVDFSVIDSLEQVREIGCIQIDVGNAERLGISYEDDGVKRYPVIIHSAVPGGIERYIYAQMDSIVAASAVSFPFWLHPVQLRVIPVSEKFVSDVFDLVEKLRDDGMNLRIEIDDRDMSVSKRVRFAREDLVPEVLVFGEKEVGDVKAVVEGLRSMADRSAGLPYLPISWPNMMKGQIR